MESNEIDVIDSQLENSKKVREFLELVSVREDEYMLSTETMLEVLRPTMLTALEELFDIDPDVVMWLSVEVESGYVFPRFMVSTQDIKNRAVLALVKQLYKIDADDNMITINLGISVTSVFKPKDELKQFFLETTEKNTAVTDPDNDSDTIVPSVLSTRFDYESLTDLQRMGLVLSRGQSEHTH